MRLGSYEITFGKGSKGYNELTTMLAREKGYLGNRRRALKTSVQSQLLEFNSWVYSATSLISDRVSSIPFNFYRRGQEEKLDTTTKGYASFVKPFMNPNELMSFRFIKAFCQLQLDLCGMAVIYKAKNGLGQVWELWPLNMNDFMRVEVEWRTGPMEPRITYWFSIAGNIFSFDSSELVVLAYPNPRHPFQPMSPIQAQAYSVDLEAYVEVYERDFFANSARVDMVLTTEEQLDQRKADEIKARWKERYQGVFHDIAVLDSGLTPQPLKFMNKDFEFATLAGWSKGKVLGAYHVPEAKLGGATNINRSAGVHLDIAFNQECIQPRLTLWDEELTKEVLSSFNPGIEIRHDNPIPRDRQIEVQEIRVAGGSMPMLTPNEVRRTWYNLGPLADDPDKLGDKLWVPSGWTLASEASKPKQPPPATNGPLNETDPARHQNDKPHLNPDGSDNRDELPTEGRSMDLVQFTKQEVDLREKWVEDVQRAFLDATPEDLHAKMQTVFQTLSAGTVVACLKMFKQRMDIDPGTLDVEDWVSGSAKQAATEFQNTVLKGMEQVSVDELPTWKQSQLNTNPRLAKLINALIRSSINYAKWLILTELGVEMEWVVNRNECGHKGRLLNTRGLKTFAIGDTTVRFPGEKINFTCDCTIMPVAQTT